jgi:ribonuclease HI
LRNEKGEVMAGYYCILENMLSPATAEATAILRGFELLEKLSCTSCQVETDSLDIIKECNGEVDINSPYAAILAECFQKASDMTEISFVHCHREANQVAHELAKYAYRSNDTQLWEGDIPSFILRYVMNDVTLLTTM